MPEGGLEKRLERIEAHQDAMLETLAVIRFKVEQTNGHVDDMLAEVGRVPPVKARGARLPITDRLHNIESVVTPVALEATVVNALRKERSHGWTVLQKVALFAVAFAGAVEGLLRLFGVGG